jgi:hypothetical protein
MAQPKINEPFEILASAARTATATSDGYNVPGMQALILFLDVTAESSTPQLTLSIEMKMPKSTTYEQVCAFTQISLSGAAQYVLIAGPGLLAAGVNGTNAQGLQTYVPPQWRVVVTAADADSATYSLGGVCLRG